MFNFEFDFNFNIIYSIHLHIASACLFSMLFIIYMFVVITIVSFKIVFIIFTVYVFIIQLYIHQCSHYSYSILFLLFIVLHLIFCIQSLYLIFVVIICEIFHYISYLIAIVWYSLLFSHLFVCDIFFILIIDYHSLDLLTLMKLIEKFSTLMLTLRIWIDCKSDFQVLISRSVYEFLWFFLTIHVWFCHLQKVNDQFDSESCQVSYWWLLLTFCLCYTETSDWLYESHVINETLSSHSSMFLSQSFISSFLIMWHNISIR